MSDLALRPLDGLYRSHFKRQRLSLLYQLPMRTLHIFEHLAFVDASWDESCYDEECVYSIFQFAWVFNGKRYPFISINSDHESMGFFQDNLNEGTFLDLFNTTFYSPEGFAIRSFLDRLKLYEMISKYSKQDTHLTEEWKDLIMFYTNSSLDLDP